MEPFVRFKEYIIDHQLIKDEEKVLLAVSGGRDSMLMSWLFAQTSYNVSIAHCNFNLRGQESDMDEQLVSDFCEHNNIKLHVKRFDTIEYANEHKISIQMAARELRYDWFQKLARDEGYDLIAVAQHHNDQIETIFVNLLRGTGIRGMHGIIPKRGNIIRPLLFLTADEVSEYLHKFDIPFRDDKSNFSTDYIRNKIRLQLIPVIREIKPDFEEVMAKNINWFQEEEEIYERLLQRERDRYFIEKGSYIYVHKDILDAFQSNLAFLYQLFRPYRFSKNVLQDLLDNKHSQTGLVFNSPTHSLLLNRSDLVIREIKGREEGGLEVFVTEGAEYICSQHHFIRFATVDSLQVLFDQNTACVDVDKLQFPLKVRKWMQGDYFYPLGMTGRKKVSDFLVDNKVNLFDKEKVEVLLNGNGDIMWIIGMRLDNRYKVDEKTKKVCKFVIQE